MSWNRNQLIRLCVSLIMTLIIIGGVALLTWFVGPIAGYRYYQAVPLFQISNQRLSDNSLSADIYNRELNPVTLSVWYQIIDAETNAEMYSADRQVLAPIAPQETREITFTIPDAYLPLEEPFKIEIKVAEFIAYVDGRSDVFDQMYFVERDEDAPVNLNQVHVSSIDDGLYRLQMEISIDNEDTQAHDFRYTFTINHKNAANNLILLEDTIFESEFFAMSVDSGQSLTDDATFEVALEHGQYVVSLWVQRLSDTGNYVHFWQTNFPETIEIFGAEK